MCEDNLCLPDQVVIFKGDFACLQAINLTAFTTGDLVFMGGKKFLPVGVSSQQNVVRWNSLMRTDSKQIMYPLCQILTIIRIYSDLMHPSTCWVTCFTKYTSFTHHHIHNPIKLIIITQYQGDISHTLYQGYFSP